MLFRTILLNFIVSINCGLQIPGNVSKKLFSAYETYQNNRKNKLYLIIIHNFMPRTLDIVLQSFQISNFSGGGGHAPELPTKSGPKAPCQYRRLLLSNWLLTSNFIESPEYPYVN